MRYFLAISALVLAQTAYGKPTPVELKMQCRDTGESTALRITLLNEGSTDASVMLGMSIGNGRWYVATSLVVELRRGLDGPIEHYLPNGGPPSIAGRLDPWIVPLPTGSEFSLTLPTAKLLTTKGGSLSLLTGESFVRARVIRYADNRNNSEMVGPGLVKVFDGELQTEWLRLPGECGVG
jgi:hypothetical protein